MNTKKFFSLAILSIMVLGVALWISFTVKQLNSKKMIVNVYASCPCEICNSVEWKGLATKNKKISDFKDFHICATDNKVIPYNSKVVYNGIEYIVKDVGSKIKGNKICILLNNHKETIIFGIKKDQQIQIIE